ncbi:MAG: T9SS type A sorting domain-containing protein [Putridiphycobacter sp.]
MKTWLLLIGTLLSLLSYSQISLGGRPEFSNSPNLVVSHTVLLDSPNLSFILKEDSLNDLAGNQYRIGVKLPTHFTLNSNSNWQILPNGNQICVVKFQVPKAQGLTLFFSAPPQLGNGNLYMTNADQSQIIGAFNASTPSFVTTEVIQGETLFLIYERPVNATSYPQLEISEVGFVYRGFEDRFLDLTQDERDNQPCEINVSCEEGLLWEKQINSSLMYTYVQNQFMYVCSASILNNTNFNCKPYILSADHCGNTTSNSNISTHVWYFNYQNPSCELNAIDPYNGNLSQTMTGGKLRASSSLGVYDNPIGVNGSDFVLIELNTNIPESYTPYFAGWSISEIPSSAGVGIHHPAGSDKKISTYATDLYSTTYNNGLENAHWGVNWSPTLNGHGVTEGGSSGSPLFNSKGQVIGILSGGTSTCEQPNQYDLYGKVNVAWQTEGTANQQQLKYWLDSAGTNFTSISGSYYPCENSTVTDSSKSIGLIDVPIYPNPTHTIIYIDLSNLKEDLMSFEIIDYSGRVVYNKLNTQGVNIINLSHFANGTYIVRLKTENEILIKKIVKI